MSDGLTPDQLRAGIAALETALASGSLSVSYAGRSVSYRSVAELRDALTYMRERLATLTGAKQARVSYIKRGL